MVPPPGFATTAKTGAAATVSAMVVRGEAVRAWALGTDKAQARGGHRRVIVVGEREGLRPWGGRVGCAGCVFFY